jgi:hypothetical protein
MNATSVPPGLARFYRPGMLELGLKILAKAQDEAARKKAAARAQARMTPEKALRAWVVNAVEDRKAMLEDKLLTAPRSRRARIAADIEACGRLLVKLEEMRS